MREPSVQLWPCGVLLMACATALGAQTFPGTYTTRNQQGGLVTLVLTDAGSGKLGGTFSGNGNTFPLTGAVVNGTASGVISGQGMSLFFQAQVQGTALLVTLVEPDARGAPNLRTAQQALMMRQAAGASSDSAGRGGAPTGAPPGGSAAAGPGSDANARGGGPGTMTMGVAAAVTPQDRQLAQLFTSTAWCYFSYSGSTTYSSSAGTTRTERVVLLPDGRVLSNQQGEFSGSGEAGSIVANNRGNASGYWRLAQGVLAFSPNGMQWAPSTLKMTQNSNGYPIPVVDGKEYMTCR